MIPPAPLSRALLARKGSATASGFTGASELVLPPAAGPATHDDARTPVETRIEARAAPLIMIVEDNALNMKMMTDLFEGNGFRTLSAVNGPQALATASAERPDLIVMDIELPGLSGLEVTRRLKADASLMTIPVIAVSARARANDATVALQAGCADYLVKPVSVADILSSVARFLR